MPLTKAPTAAVTGADPRTASAGKLDLRWDVLLIAIAGYMLTSVGRVHQLFPILEVLRPAILTGGVAIALYLLDGRGPRQWHHLVQPTTKYLLAFFAWMVLSVPFALRVGTSFELVFGNFIKTVVMYCIVAGAVRGVRDVERLGFVYLLAAAIYAAVVIVRFDVGGDAWRLAGLYYYDANDFATFAVTALPLGLYFLGAGRRLLMRVLAAVALVALTLAFVRTGSRGGFVALIVVAGFIALRYTTIPLRWRLGGTILVVLVVLGAASERYWQQMGTIVSDSDYNMTEESGRLQIWQRGLGYMLEYPVLGVGPDNFATAEGILSPFATRQQYGFGVRWNAAHNSFIQVGVDLGIPGLILFVAIIVSIFAALRRGSPRRRAGDGPPRPSHALSRALTASMIGFVVGAFFLSLAYSEIFYTLAALAVGLHKVTAGSTPGRN